VFLLIKLFAFAVDGGKKKVMKLEWSNKRNNLILFPSAQHINVGHYKMLLKKIYNKSY